MSRQCIEKEALQDLYAHQGKATTEIAAITGINASTVARLLHRYGIPIRCRKLPRATVKCSVCGKEFEFLASQVAKGRRKFCSLKCRYRSQEGQPARQVKFCLTRDQLYELYVTRRLSSEEIAPVAGVNASTVLDWLHRYRIEVRPSTWKAHEVTRELHAQKRHPFSKRKTPTERRAQSVRQRGADHWMTGRGKAAHGYGDNWYWVAKMARMRDKRVCRVCGKTGRTSVHHIVPVKAFVVPEHANCLGNMITLCGSCHKIVERFYGVDRRLTPSMCFTQSGLLAEWRSAYLSSTWPWKTTRASSLKAS